MTVVLMYHALYRGSDTSAIDSEDMPYAVSEDQFAAQLDRVAERGAGIFCTADTPNIVITFDDGHRSNLDIAAPMLVERGLPAYFFVTSGFIDQRTGFMSSAELKELATAPGMVIGSHGVSHQFFADMSHEQAARELLDSRIFVEDATGEACQSMSFPGGRYERGTLEMMRKSGYLQWFGSDTGTIDASQYLTYETSETAAETTSLLAMASTLPLSRTAIRHQTQLAEFDRMIAPDVTYYRKLRRRSQAKKLLQRTLGNRLYHGLYKSISAR